MPKTVFVDGNILTRLPGTRLLAAWLNKVFAHRHDGRDQDGSAPLDFGEDTGAVNAIVAAMPMPFDALIVGLPFGVRVANTNTAAVTVNVDGLGSHPLHKLGGLELDAGDIQETQIVRIAWDGTNFQLLSYNSPPVTDAVTLQGQGAAMLAPPGIKGEFFMPTAPAGWLPCDGRTVLRAQYPGLFLAVGTTWGAGDNVSTFAIPEARGEFFRAWDNGRGVDADRQFGSWQSDQNKSHTHTLDTFLSYPAASGVEQLQSPGDPDTYSELGGISGSEGGAEVRVRNIAVLVCIKY